MLGFRPRGRNRLLALGSPNPFWQQTDFSGLAFAGKIVAHGQHVLANLPEIPPPGKVGARGPPRRFPRKRTSRAEISKGPGVHGVFLLGGSGNVTPEDTEHGFAGQLKAIPLESSRFFGHLSRECWAFGLGATARSHSVRESIRGPEKRKLPILCERVDNSPISGK